MIKRLPINLEEGERIVYIGSEVTRADGTEKLRPGDVGLVIEVKPPVHGTGQEIDDGDEPFIDEGCDGYARVQWPNFRVTLARRSLEGHTWRRA